MKLIYQRGFFEEFMEDDIIKETLIAARSEEEYQEMVDCLTKEKEQQEAFVRVAGEIREYYERKVRGVIGRVNNV